MNKSRLGRTLTGISLGTGHLCDIIVAETSDRCSTIPFVDTMDEVSLHCVRTDRHRRWNHERLNELVSIGFFFLPRWAEWMSGTNGRIERNSAWA